MPSRVCTEPTCPNPPTYRGRCPTHARQRNRETRSRNVTIYNTKRWRMTRRRKLSLTPLCENCGDIATDVHHRTDIQQGGDIWAMDNLQSLCHGCHSQETRKRQQGL